MALPYFTAPSKKALLQAGFNAEQAQAIRDLLHGIVKPGAYASVRHWRAECYHPPTHIECVMCAIDEIIHGCGTESIWGEKDEQWPVAEYVNTGDTYSATILYCYETHTFRLTTWGGFYERYARRFHLEGWREHCADD